MTSDSISDYLDGLPPASRDAVDRLILIVSSASDLDAAIKWRQLTFAADGDFDHWVCAIAANKAGVNLVFHFGSLLADRAGAFSPSEAKFIRKLSYRTAADVDEAVVRDLLDQALDELPRFRASRRGLAGPARRPT